MMGDNHDSAHALAQTEIQLVRATVDLCRTLSPAPGQSMWEAFSKCKSLSVSGSAFTESQKLACFNLSRSLGDVHIGFLADVQQAWIDPKKIQVAPETLQLCSQLPPAAPWVIAALVAANLLSPFIKTVVRGSARIGQQVPDAKIKALGEAAKGSKLAQNLQHLHDSCAKTWATYGVREKAVFGASSFALLSSRVAFVEALGMAAGRLKQDSGDCGLASAAKILIQGETMLRASLVKGGIEEAALPPRLHGEPALGTGCEAPEPGKAKGLAPANLPEQPFDADGNAVRGAALSARDAGLAVGMQVVNKAGRAGVIEGLRGMSSVSLRWQDGTRQTYFISNRIPAPAANKTENGGGGGGGGA
jgi:hypothetical protein